MWVRHVTVYTHIMQHIHDAPLLVEYANDILCSIDHSRHIMFPQLLLTEAAVCFIDLDAGTINTTPVSVMLQKWGKFLCRCNDSEHCHQSIVIRALRKADQPQDIVVIFASDDKNLCHMFNIRVAEPFKPYALQQPSSVNSDCVV